MTEPDRNARNLERLRECHPAFRVKLANVIAQLEALGERPRIQDAYRSPEVQQTLKKGKTSKLTWGYHCCAAADGTPESLAADVLDDNHPDDTVPNSYKLRLARAAAAHGLSTGATFGLDKDQKAALAEAIVSAAPPPEGLKYGWDPTHVQWVGISVMHAKAGKRPELPTF